MILGSISEAFILITIGLTSTETFLRLPRTIPFKNFFIPRKTGVEYGNPRNFRVRLSFSQWLFLLYLNQREGAAAEGLR
jgi:hypothetical protein